MPTAQRRELVKGTYPFVSVQRQCQLLGVNRSSYYYSPRGESAFNLMLMRLMDEHYLDHPYKGPRRMQSWLRRKHDLDVNMKRLNRLYYKVMGLNSVLPGPHTTKPRAEHKKYPYLLRNLVIERPNQVWATDITYIPMLHGYLYLTALLDVFSRYVLLWSVSNTMTAEWCVELFSQAKDLYGPPEIMNTDQGSQYTSEAFTDAVLGNSGTALSMTGCGRATDNAYIERLWRSVKYECVYLYEMSDGLDLDKRLTSYFDYYNTDRDHQSLAGGIPQDYYFIGP